MELFLLGLRLSDVDRVVNEPQGDDWVKVLFVVRQPPPYNALEADLFHRS